ncbi:MAG TPA: carbonic anhydrase [Dehalococcoidia bacterium]|nr:carbonic anhydrase [Dehalococcoidia bacterium]
MSDHDLYTRATCSALVITCSDFRFKRAERLFIEATGLADDYDLIARPGAARSLVAPRNDAARASMEDEIRMLYDAHGFTRVLMLHHLSCRAYDDLAVAEGQRAVHAAHLRAASAVLAQRLPGVAPEPYLVALFDGVLRVDPVFGA